MTLVIKGPGRVWLGCGKVVFIRVVDVPFTCIVFTFRVFVGFDPRSIQFILTPKFALRNNESKDFVGLRVYFCKVGHILYLCNISYYDDPVATRTTG